MQDSHEEMQVEQLLYGFLRALMEEQTPIQGREPELDRLEQDARRG
ncbi:MAG: hypothetical protein AB7P04_05875 [Bacteriovoracia bacterium]